MFSQKSVFIHTIGCSANQSDSEIMAGVLTKAGFNIVHKSEFADIIILNTCFVKNPTENKCRILIERYSKSGKYFIVSGCLAQSHPEIIREIAPKASLIGTRAVTKIVDIVAKTIDGKRIEELGSDGEKVCVPKIRRNPVIDIVQISQGCLGSCSFCATKSARGNLVSFSAEEIIREISSAKSTGCKEFWLTSQDCGAWGLDIGKNLSFLLQKITSEVKGKYFIRVGMANPLHLKLDTEKIIKAFHSKNIFKFIHIPIQSGSDKILADMKRGHTANDAIEIISEFHKAFPQIQIWTDIIVGYPTEADDDFEKSLDLIKSISPDYVNVSRFGARPGTEAAKMKPLLKEIVTERSARMSELCRKISIENNKKWIGWRGEIIVDEFNQKKKSWIGRNFAYKPVVIRGAKKVRLGDIIETEIYEVGTVLFGDMIEA